MAREAEELEAAIRIFEASLGQRLLGLGVGGSLATGTADHLSDVDLFVVVDADLAEAVGWVVNIAQEWGQCARGDWTPGFGWQVVAVTPDRGILEVFVNTPETLVPNVLWQRTEIVYDPKGLLQGVKCAREPESRSDEISASLVMAALAAHSIRKLVARGRLHETHRRMDDLRRHTAQFVVLTIEGGSLDKKEVFRAALWTRPEWSRRLENCVPRGHTWEALGASVQAVRELLDHAAMPEQPASQAVERWLKETLALLSSEGGRNPAHGTLQ